LPGHLFLPVCDAHFDASRQAPASLLLVSRAGLTFFCGALALLPSELSVLSPDLFLLVLKPFLTLLFFSSLDLFPSLSHSYHSRLPFVYIGYLHRLGCRLFPSFRWDALWGIYSDVTWTLTLTLILCEMQKDSISCGQLTCLVHICTKSLLTISAICLITVCQLILFYCLLCSLCFLKLLRQVFLCFLPSSCFFMGRLGVSNKATCLVLLLLGF